MQPFSEKYIGFGVTLQYSLRVVLICHLGLQALFVLLELIFQDMQTLVTYG